MKPPRRLRSPQRSVTIHDVAREAKISVTAVSRHFNQRIVLPAATAARIDLAAATLGYRPNVAARRLSTGSSESLGIVISDVAQPLFAAVASAAEAECAKHGFSLLIFNSRNLVENELASLARIEDAQVDGMLFMTNHPSQPEMMETVNRVRNVVLLDEDVIGARAVRLFARNREGGRIATEHLIAFGHRRIAYVGGAADLMSSRERHIGYIEALKAHGIDPDPGLTLFSGYEPSAGEQAFAQLDRLEQPPTAIFAAADAIAIGILRAARRAGVAVPERLSLVGFDDIQNADVLGPPLTTIHQSGEIFGRRGVQLLLNVIAGRLPEPTTEYVDVHLVERSSATRPRKDQHWRFKPG